MRSDLNKQLCERERHRSWDRYGNYRHKRIFNNFGEEGEGQPTRESMKRRYVVNWRAKDLNENLNPLWGAVRKNVGKRWDKFYSELCTVFDKRSVINQHILDHLFQRVVTDMYVGEDGKLYQRNYYGRNFSLLDGTIEYYVDPRDGILKRNKHYRSYRMAEKERAKIKAQEEYKTCRQISNTLVFRKIDGLWFAFEMKTAPLGEVYYVKPSAIDMFKTYDDSMQPWDKLTDAMKARYGIKRFRGAYVTDMFTGRAIFRSPSDRFGPKYHANKRTASKKEIRDYGLD